MEIQVISQYLNTDLLWERRNLFGSVGLHPETEQWPRRFPVVAVSSKSSSCLLPLQLYMERSVSNMLMVVGFPMALPHFFPPQCCLQCLKWTNPEYCVEHQGKKLNIKFTGNFALCSGLSPSTIISEIFLFITQRPRWTIF